jgi:phage shock protein PspC (stress-responsive transcriptional regulator)
VALALANYFDLDVTLVRLMWVLVAVFGGCGVLAYFVGWLVIPDEPAQLPAAAPSQQPAQ